MRLLFIGQCRNVNVTEGYAYIVHDKVNLSQLFFFKLYKEAFLNYLKYRKFSSAENFNFL